MITENNPKTTQEIKLVTDLNIVKSEERNQLDVQHQAISKLNYLFQAHMSYLAENLADNKIDTPMAKEVEGFYFACSHTLEELESSTEHITKYIKGLDTQLEQLKQLKQTIVS